DGEVTYIIHRVQDATEFVRLQGKHVGIENQIKEWRERAERLEVEIFAHTQQVQKVNEQLRSANESSKSLLASISDGFCSLDRSWRFIYVNDREAAMIGVPAEALIGKSFWEFFSDPPDGVLHRQMGRAMHEGVPVEFEYFDDRHCRWIEKHAYPSEQGISCLARDVTARKKAETRLAAQHSVTRILSRAQTFNEAAPALLPALCSILEAQVAALWMLQPNGRELLCVGLHNCDDSPEAMRFTEESRRIHLLGGESLPGRVWLQRKSLWIADLSKEENFVRKEIAQLAGLRSAVAFPISNGDEFFGVIEFFLKRLCEDDATLLDTTAALGTEIAQFIQHKRADEALLRSEQQHRALVTASSDVLYRMSPDWGEMRHLHGGAFMVDKAEPSSNWLSEYIPPEDHGKVSASIRDAIRNKSIFELEHRVKRPNNALGWVFSRAIPILHANGEIIEWFGVASDITERKEAQANLREYAANLEKAVAERTAELRDTVAELEAFSYSLSHDMRGPLNAIQGFTQIVLEDCGEAIGPSGTVLLGKVLSAGARLDRLIRDVLAFTVVSRKDIVRSRIQLEKLVLEIIKEAPDLQPPQAEVTVSPPLLPVLGNEASITQCLSNLLGNAVKFVAPGILPRVRIWTEVRGDHVRLWIEDNGIGISQKSQAKVFEIFNRLHSQNKYEGTGMGLAIVRRAVERMGGTAGVESEPGRGSRFWVLPKGD
nr:PAS domain-containing protein [Verrucomicrobiota bacterium]